MNDKKDTNPYYRKYISPEEFLKGVDLPPELEYLKEKAKMYLSISDNITCEYCGLRSGDAPHIKFHIDHIVPRFFGGTNDPENLADACMPCNLRKKDQRGWKTLSGRIGKSNYMKYEDGGWRMPGDA